MCHLLQRQLVREQRIGQKIRKERIHIGGIRDDHPVHSCEGEDQNSGTLRVRRARVFFRPTHSVLLDKPRRTY